MLVSPVSLVVLWISLLAFPLAGLRAEEVSVGGGHWSLQPMKDPVPPPVKDAAMEQWVKSPLDQFILAGLEAKGLKPAVKAEKLALLRRVSFDLTGLPPSLDQQLAFLSDRSPKGFAKVVDDLLARPQYGERWGRHWLDVARYADTAGESADYPIPQAWLYRNWVVDAFNRDLPYDQFLKDQLAGDLLPAANDAERHQKIIATGFIALSRRFSVDPDGAMHLTIEDTLDTLSKATMGYSLSCARCHDHKFDPIPMKDYYALYGIFSSTRYPFPGSENKKRQRDFIPLTSQEEWERAMEPFKAQLAPIDRELESLREERDALVAIRRGETPAITPKLSFTAVRDRTEALNKEREAIMDLLPIMPTAFAVAEARDVKDAAIQNRGEPFDRGDVARRGFLTMLGGQALPSDEKSSGRRQLAEWIATPQNPLTARVMVNRVWQHHFGRGLVGTPNDFGSKGQRPTHPELLDWLATRFVEDGWSLKKLHRRILLSATYQQSSAQSEAATAKDPLNEWLSSFPRRRLDAEAIRDAMLAVSENLDYTPGGEHPFPAQKTWKFTQHAPFTAVYPTNKRSIYLMQQRIRKHPFLAVFDGADTNTSTGARQLSNTPLQALFMMNDAFTHEQANSLAKRLVGSAEEETGRINLAHCIMFGRPATAEEMERGVAFLEQVKTKFPPAEAERQAWASYTRVLLGSNEFIYID